MIFQKNVGNGFKPFPTKKLYFYHKIFSECWHKDFCFFAGVSHCFFDFFSEFSTTFSSMGERDSSVFGKRERSNIFQELTFVDMSGKTSDVFDSTVDFENFTINNDILTSFDLTSNCIWWSVSDKDDGRELILEIFYEMVGNTSSLTHTRSRNDNLLFISHFWSIEVFVFSYFEANHHFFSKDLFLDCLRKHTILWSFLRKVDV